ncbi:WNK protein Kinase, partial [Phytophthora palmivora]
MEESDVYVREEGDRPVEQSPRGRYIRFDIRLGTGAYKSVYKAYDTDQGIDVAWNAIDIGLLPSTEKTRIIQEVQLLQKLEHKNIINFYGSWFSKEKNQVVFITEIMTSGTLKSYIKRVQFIKWKIIKRWCLQILEGLHYLHSQNPPVIHRDLKCDNIFVNGNTGDLRIGDLGLSTQLAVDKRSKAQSVLGTPEFMAPELYDESYDEKVDVYAFGMCVLEMVTKEVPYSECINPAQIYKKVTAGIRPKGLQRVRSQAARDFIELCLSRGNGLVDVTAQYLLDHPFLKAQDDDNDMVECLDEDELERESKEQQQRLEKVAEESFAVEFNMESGSKDSATVV